MKRTFSGPPTQKCVLVFDINPLIINCKRSDELFKILKSPTVIPILWARYQFKEDELFIPISTFKHVIRGLIGGIKSQKELRASLQNEKKGQILGLPFILIDSDAKSIASGGFDFVISHSNIKVGTFSSLLDNPGMLQNEIDKCLKKWATHNLPDRTCIGNKRPTQVKSTLNHQWEY